MLQKEIPSARQRYLARKRLLDLGLDIEGIENRSRTAIEFHRTRQVWRSPFYVIHDLTVHLARVNDDARDVRREKIAHDAGCQAGVAVHERRRLDLARFFLDVTPLLEQFFQILAQCGFFFVLCNRSNNNALILSASASGQCGAGACAP